MKDVAGTIEFDGKVYSLVFNLNVMQAIQEEYQTIEAWGALTDGTSGEPNAKAIIFGLREMINEGIDIQNEKTGSNEAFLTLKQVGRLISSVGLQNAAQALTDTVIASTKGETKNG